MVCYRHSSCTAYLHYRYLDTLGTHVARLLDKEKAINEVERLRLMRDLPVLARTVSLFCQHGNFDRLREDSPDARPFIDSLISKESVQDGVYKQMIDLYYLTAGTSLHGMALHCLGLSFPYLSLRD